MANTTRRDIRARWNLNGGGFQDCLTSAFCYCAALVQEAKEVVYRTSEEKQQQSSHEPRHTTSGRGMEYKSEGG